MYDPSTHPQCPHCRSKQGGPEATEPSSGTKTTPLQSMSPFASAKTEPLMPTASSEGLRSASTTPGFMTTQSDGEAKVFNPVVGWLVVVEGPARGKDFRLIAGKNTIGRDAEASAQITGDEQISRSHATLYYYPKVNAFYLEDHSTHGTFHNGEPVVQRIKVENMGIIELGKTKLLLRALCDTGFIWDEFNA
jgi:FOG: FHA domain